MQVRVEGIPMRLLAAQLTIIVIGVAFILYEALALPSSKLIGAFLLVIGVMHLFFFKSTGRRFFAKTQVGWTSVARFWARGGERGTQLLFLGMGIILAIAAIVLLVFGRT